MLKEFNAALMRYYRSYVLNHPVVTTLAEQLLLQQIRRDFNRRHIPHLLRINLFAHLGQKIGNEKRHLVGVELVNISRKPYVRKFFHRLMIYFGIALAVVTKQQNNIRPLVRKDSPKLCDFMVGIKNVIPQIKLATWKFIKSQKCAVGNCKEWNARDCFRGI